MASPVPAPSHLASQTDATALREVATMSADEALQRLGARRNGLNPNEVEERRARFGRNEVAHEKPPAWYVQLAHAFWTPFTLVLMALAVISWFTGDVSAAVIIGVMVALATILRFTQEFRSSQAAHALRLMVRTSALLERQEPTDPDVVDSPLASRRREVPIEESSGSPGRARPGAIYTTTSASGTRSTSSSGAGPWRACGTCCWRR